jgi:hypothetical protein
VTRPVRRCLFALLLAVGGCKVEEDVRLSSDGSGTVEVRLAFPASFEPALDEVVRDAREKGYEERTRGKSGDETFVVVGKSFLAIGELSDRADHYSLELSDTGWGESHTP